MYLESTRLKDADNNIVSPAEEGSLSLLRRIFQLLKPLGIITGGGSNRLNIDVNNVATLGTVTTVSTVTAVTTVTTVTGVTTVGTVSNQTAMGGIPAFDMMRALSRTGYANGPRANIVVS
jgi:hypothetical protein